MEEVLQFLEKYEMWGYVLLGGVSIFHIQKLVLAWEELRVAVYGLERETAQRRLSSSLTVLVLLLLAGLVEFIVVSFVAPSYPWGMELSTPTLDLLVTSTATLQSPQETPSLPPSLTMTPEGVAADGCVPGQIEWAYPTSGEEIKEIVELKGTVNIPDLGFYKYEYSQPGSDSWLTIAAGNEIRVDQELGSWNTELIIPGDYLLRLVVVNSDNQTLLPCEIQVRVVSP